MHGVDLTDHPHIESMIARWRFRGLQSNTIVDSTDSGFHLTGGGYTADYCIMEDNVDASTVGSTRSNFALASNGAQYITASHPNITLFDVDFTIEFWYYRELKGTKDCIIATSLEPGLNSRETPHICVDVFDSNRISLDLHEDKISSASGHAINEWYSLK